VKEFKMKIVTMTLLAGLAVTPALAQPAADQDNVSAAATAESKTAVAPVSENANVDDQTAAADIARQKMYKHKLDAAKAQSNADSAIADRDAAQAKAEDDRADKNAAEARSPQ
jgi:hypothetical protein